MVAFLVQLEFVVDTFRLGIVLLLHPGLNKIRILVICTYLQREGIYIMLEIIEVFSIPASV